MLKIIGFVAGLLFALLLFVAAIAVAFFDVVLTDQMRDLALIFILLDTTLISTGMRIDKELEKYK